MPEGSSTGATYDNSRVPGALNMGQQASTGLTLCKSHALDQWKEWALTV